MHYALVRFEWGLGLFAQDYLTSLLTVIIELIDLKCPRKTLNLVIALALFAELLFISLFVSVIVVRFALFG